MSKVTTVIHESKSVIKGVSRLTLVAYLERVVSKEEAQL